MKMIELHFQNIMYQKLKDFNVLIYEKPVYEIPVKRKEESYEQIIAMSKNNDYTTGNLFDYEYFKDNYQ